MARKKDTGFRDARLAVQHQAYGVDLPLPGMTFPTVEYDRGEAVAIVNYIRRADVMPSGHDVGAAYNALGRLLSPIGTQLPFWTVRYDPRNWAMQVLGHNAAASSLFGMVGWTTMTEERFVRELYRLRGRSLPNLTQHGVELSTAPWQPADGPLKPVDWPGQDMSVRRRAYEPEGPGVTFRMRNPCADIDLAVVGAHSRRVQLIVDFKLASAYVDPKHKTHMAMATILGEDGGTVPSMIVRYQPGYDAYGDAWTFRALCLNETAEDLLSGACGVNVLSGDWTELSERQWCDVLDTARGRSL